MRVIIGTADSMEVLADTDIEVGKTIRLLLPNRPNEIRIALVRDGPGAQNEVLCLLLK